MNKGRKSKFGLEQHDDPLMTAKQLAAYLSVNERTVLKLVGEGTLPGVKVGNQWRFRKVMIDAWLDDQMIGVTPRYVDTPKWLDDQMIGVTPRYVDTPNMNGPPRHLLELASCFRPEHIIAELSARSKNGVVEELVIRAYDLGLVRDKTWFVGALIERENVMPSAIGNGIAFLHTLHRSPEQVSRPFMVLGRSTVGVDFDALDNAPTHLFFVLGLKFNELHLPWLQKLSQILIQPERVRAILAAPDRSAIYGVLAEAERRLLPIATADAVQ